MGWLAGWLVCWLADKTWINFEFLKFVIEQIFKTFAVFNEVTALLEPYECVKLVFLAKTCF